MRWAMTLPAAFERSITGQAWRWRGAGGDADDLVTQLLLARGCPFEELEAHRNPTIRAFMPDPSIFRDMDAAAHRLADAVMSGENVTIFGDYDVDGATSSALLVRYFRAVGLEIDVYIPDRIKEGYGPNASALEKLGGNGINLLITVDCGVTAFDAIAAGTAAGLDIDILDHHRAEAQLPDAFAVVNPNRLDDVSGQGHLAAVGVTFLTLVAVNRLLRTRGWFNEERPEPRILQWLDIVALGTVCDVVPLTGLNRAFVAQGLRVMAMRQNKGIVALAEVADVAAAPVAFHLGYIFGPRVNAGGRVGESGLGARILSTEDPIEVRSLALRLHQYNAERKTIEELIIEEALAQSEETVLPDDIVVMVGGDGWHPGVIGIVAARLKEKYNKPACVIAFDENGIGKASGRSVSGIDLGGAVIAAKQQGLLIAGGGHKMAAGFTVARSEYPALRNFINMHAREQLQGREFKPELRLDAVLSLHSLTLSFAEQLERLSPYGAGHSEPRFVITGVKIIKPYVVGEKHVSCFLQDSSGGASLKAIAFRAMDNALGQALLTSASAPFQLAGHVTINEWQGRKTVQFQIVDASPLWT